MTASSPRTFDPLAVAALSLIAMCIVTFDHEALGHGGVCLALGGHIQLLTSSLFRCGVRSAWIDPAGPLTNAAIGLLALAARRALPKTWVSARLLLILITAFSLFWESGYLVKAMIGRDGDLYYAAYSLFGEPALWLRLAGGGVGAAIYLWTFRLTAGALRRLGSDPARAQRAGQIAWLAATLGAGLAALAYHGVNADRDHIDAWLEIGAGALPLLLIRQDSDAAFETEDATAATMGGRGISVALAAGVYALFVATLGRGWVG